MPSFPNSIKSFTTKTNGQTIDASHPNDIQSEVVAIETNLLSGSTGQVYAGGTPPGFTSTVSLHSLALSSNLTALDSTLGNLTVSSGLTAAKSTIGNIQAGNSTITGNLNVTGTLTNPGIPALLAGSTFATASTVIVDLSTFTSSFSQLDTLEIEYTLEASTVAINNFRLRNKTDGVTVVDLNDQSGVGDFAAGRSGVGVCVIRMAPSATTKVLPMNSLQQDNNVRRETGAVATYTTAWSSPIEYAIQGACSTTLGNLRGSFKAVRKVGQ